MEERTETAAADAVQPAASDEVAPETPDAEAGDPWAGIDAEVEAIHAETEDKE